MSTAPVHNCRVLASPWPGVYATDIDSARHYGKHWHATFGLGLIDRGAHRSSSGSGAVDAYAGDIVTTNPGEVHDGRPLGAPSRRWRTVYIEPEIVVGMQAASDAPAEVEFTHAAFADARLRSALLALLRQMELWTTRSPQADALACEEALVHACGLMLRDHSTVRGGEDGDADLRKVIERLGDAGVAPPPARPSLAELAALAGVGKFQLLRRFKKAFGTTPHAWLLQHRAEVARCLIGRGASITDAAASTGFADQSHLTRVFVQRFGFTPGAWRMSLRA